MIIGLSGKIGCGKTYLCRKLLELLPMYERVGFADILKQECADKFGFPLQYCYSQEGKEKTVSLVHDNCSESGGSLQVRQMKVREVLQWYGTDVCRKRDQNHWVKAMDKFLLGAGNVIIDDVRFPNEARFCRDRGMCIRIMPYPEWEPGPFANHESETALDSSTDFDAIISPAYGQLTHWARWIVRTFYEKDDAEFKAMRRKGSGYVLP